MALIYFSINFLLFVLLLFFILKKPLSAFLVKRKATFVEDSEKARIEHEDALLKFKEIKNKLDTIKEIGERYIEDFKKQALVQSDLIINNAFTYSKNVLSGSEQIIEEEIKKTRRLKVKTFIGTIVEKTRKDALLKENILSNKKYIEEYFRAYEGGLN